jgi:N-ethylmaleimide reductase
VFGRGRVGIRISPHATQDGTIDSAPHQTFGYLAAQLQLRGVAYLHLIEPVQTRTDDLLAPVLRKAFRGPLIVCGGFDRRSADAALASGHADAVAFGSGFIANPDLVERLRSHAPWNTPDPTTFSAGGDAGYIDYPFLSDADPTRRLPAASR